MTRADRDLTRIAAQGSPPYNKVFTYARLRAYAWAELHHSNEVPLALVLEWCREAASMLSIRRATDKQIAQDARSIAEWMPENYTPGFGVRRPRKTAHEIYEARVAGQARGAAMRNARTLDRMRASIAELQSEGRRLTRKAVARASGLGINAVSRNWSRVVGSSP